ncbi:MFS transporter [Paenibacillus spiritus]|uniref:MFS transporter n=1 Tax=Paenibacillus spiritus TaxID=2496557 RepID=A0A5J5GHK3_9BACL|nr:MFS transporter [Paenibacillus spiritus]KAA9007567.1 MFS transporter [Paenibacillus spiritus]
MKWLKTYHGLSKEVYYLCLARTINSMGDFVFSLITLFLTIQLGLSALAAGTFVSMAALTSGPGVLLGGYLSDRIGKKKVIVLGQLAAGLIVAGCALVPGSYLVAYLLIAVMFFLSITRPAYNALVIQLSAEEKERKTIFSLMYLGVNLGIALGPLLAGLFIRHHMDYVFGGIGVIFLVSTAIIQYKVNISTKSNAGTAHRQAPGAGVQASEPAAGWYWVLRLRPLVAWFVVISFLNYFIYMQASFSIPLQMNTSFGDRGATYFGYVMTVNAITVILATTVLLNVTRWMNPLVAIAVGAVLYGAGFGGLSLLSAHPYLGLVAASTVIWTLGEILIQTNINLFTASRVPDTHQGRMNGILLFVGCLGYTLCPPLTGVLLKQISLGRLWLLILALSLLYSLLMLVLLHKDRKRAGQGMNGKPPFSEESSAPV